MEWETVAPEQHRVCSGPPVRATEEVKAGQRLVVLSPGSQDRKETQALESECHKAQIQNRDFICFNLTKSFNP